MSNRERQFVNKLRNFNEQNTARAKRLLNAWKETGNKNFLDLAIMAYQDVRRNNRIILAYTKEDGRT